jgi:hypothetical protein
MQILISWIAEHSKSLFNLSPFFCLLLYQLKCLFLLIIFGLLPNSNYLDWIGPDDINIRI